MTSPFRPRAAFRREKSYERFSKKRGFVSPRTSTERLPAVSIKL